jgi:heme exporter protein D
MELVDLAIRILHNVPLDTVIQALTAAGVIGVILQKTKKWFEVQSNGVINFINFVLSAVAIMIQGIVTASAQNPTLITGKALSLMGLVILLYHSIIKPISSLSQEVKDRREQKARLKQSIFTEEDQTEKLVPIESVVPQFAAVPADVPVGVTPATPEEFAA